MSDIWLIDKTVIYLLFYVFNKCTIIRCCLKKNIIKLEMIKITNKSIKIVYLLRLPDDYRLIAYRWGYHRTPCHPDLLWPLAARLLMKLVDARTKQQTHQILLIKPFLSYHNKFKIIKMNQLIILKEKDCTFY